MKQTLLSSIKFGSVFLDKCIGVTGQGDGQEDKTDKLRAVKRLQKPRNEVTLSAELPWELDHSNLLRYQGKLVPLVHIPFQRPEEDQHDTK